MNEQEERPTVYLLPNESLVRWLKVLLRIFSGYTALFFIFALFRYSIWAKLSRGVPITTRQVWLVEILNVLGLAVLVLILLGIATVFLVWLYRVYANFFVLRIKKPHYGLVWSVISWFVPLVNIVFPVRIVLQLTRVYEHFLIQKGMLRLDAQRRTLVGWWWFTWVVGMLSWYHWSNLAMTVMFLHVFSILMMLLSSLLLFRVVRNIHMMELGIQEMGFVQVASAQTSDDLLDADSRAGLDF